MGKYEVKRNMLCAKVIIFASFFIYFIDFVLFLFTFFEKSDKIN